MRLHNCTSCTHLRSRTFLADSLNFFTIQRPSPTFISPLWLHSLRPWPHRRATTEAVRVHSSAEDSLSYIPNSRDGRPARNNDPPSGMLYKSRHLKKELFGLRDPMKLADKTARLLEINDYYKALALVRAASKDMECVVSWNRLVDYNMAMGRVTAAVKIYNEMKKRAQDPDAHTYTALFRGFGQSAHFPQTLQRALSIYHAMFAAGSSVQPSIIHTNAVLKVCAMAGDMDALFGVAAELSPRGKGSANHLTYTIILNAIRNQAWHGRRDQGILSTHRGKQKTTNRTILQARRLWEEMRDRWASGEIHIDEEMVCALGRVLLLSSTERDVDDILSLLEQTMGIPRQIPPSGSPARNGSSQDQSVLEDSETIEDPVNPDLTSLPSPSEPSSTLSNTNLQKASSYEGQKKVDSTSISPFAALPKPVPKSFFPRPGRNTLSLALDACTRMHLLRAGQDYWGLLTSPDKYNICPDSENYHMYLRLLRLKRASKMALEMVEEMRAGNIPMAGKKEEGGLEIKTFRIAMSCCVRDSQNRNALNHAAKLVRIMMDTFESPDARVLNMYLTLALSQRPRDWRILMSVIRGTELGVRNLRSLLAYDPPAKEKEEETKDEVSQLVRTLIGAFDVVRDLGKEEIPQEDRVRIREQRFMLDSWLKKVHDRKRAKENGERNWPKPASPSVSRNHEDEDGIHSNRLLSDHQIASEQPRGRTGGSKHSPQVTAIGSRSHARPSLRPRDEPRIRRGWIFSNEKRPNEIRFGKQPQGRIESRKRSPQFPATQSRSSATPSLKPRDEPRVQRRWTMSREKGASENRFRKIYAEDRDDEDSISWKHALRNGKRKERRDKEKRARGKRLGMTGIGKDVAMSAGDTEVR